MIIKKSHLHRVKDQKMFVPSCKHVGYFKCSVLLCNDIKKNYNTVMPVLHYCFYCCNYCYDVCTMGRWEK